MLLLIPILEMRKLTSERLRDVPGSCSLQIAKPGLKPQKHSFAPHREAEVIRCGWAEVDAPLEPSHHPVGQMREGERLPSPEGQRGAWRVAPWVAGGTECLGGGHPRHDNAFHALNTF